MKTTKKATEDWKEREQLGLAEDICFGIGACIRYRKSQGATNG